MREGASLTRSEPAANRFRRRSTPHPFRPMPQRQATSGRHVDHPRYAKAVGDHAEARGEESLGQRHLYLTAVAQSGEKPLGLGIGGYGQRQGEALEIGLSQASTVRRQHGRITDAEVRVHDLVLGARRDHAGLMRSGAVLEAHEHRHLGAKLGAVKLDRSLAAAVKEQVGLDLHGVSFRSLGVIVQTDCPRRYTTITPATGSASYTLVQGEREAPTSEIPHSLAVRLRLYRPHAGLVRHGVARQDASYRICRLAGG